ncbi:MAG: translation initiation factor IF-2 [Firmicutes bacterium]|nr:translation initiation factor IF-2 [Bacillota bacterium]
MGKIRVYELAKELEVDSKKIIDVLQRQGINLSGHMAVLDEHAEKAARSHFRNASGFRPKVTRIKKEVVEAERAEREKQEAVAAVPEKEKAAAPAAPKESKPAAAPEPAVAAKPESKEAPAASARPQSERKPQAEAPAGAERNVERNNERANEQNNERANNERNNERSNDRGGRNNDRRNEAAGNRDRANNERGNNERVNNDRPQRDGQRDNNRPQRDGYNNNRPPRDGQRDNNRPQRDGYNNNRPQRDGQRDNNRPQRDGYNNNRPPRDGQRDNNRPQRDGYNNNRPPRDGQRDNNRPQRDGYNNNRPPRDGQRDNNRPQRDGYNNNRPQRDGQRGGAPTGGGFQKNRSAAAPFVPPAPVTQKPDSRRADKPEKKKKDMEQRYNKDRFNAMEKANKNRPRNKYKEQKKQNVEVAPATPKKIVIGETIILSELAKSMHKTASELIKCLFGLGIMATINQTLDSDTAILVADEFGIEVEVRQEKIVEILEDETDNEKDMRERPPVVTVMGHVDHGKTSLLDAIRNTRVTSTEAGGITQHIGAYQVEINNKKITFLDTPGHEAFTSMRARGAQVTDISILVVAADDGIMPQTVEAINHSKAAGVPIIVAINKIDKPGANIDRVMQQLTEHGLVSEDWGGDTIMVPVSAKQGTNIETLLEMILLVAEVAELKANPKRQARGTVIEAKLDRNRGPLATLLIQKGTLQVGETIVAGSVFGKVRAMYDDTGRAVRSAGPSMPVEIMGFSEVPEAGETFIGIKDERDARYAAQFQAIRKREEEMRKSSKVSLDDLFSKIAEGEVKELNIIIKADVRGSVEAISQSMEKLSTDEVKVRIIHVGVGAINESDVTLADASNAIIIGFNVRPDAQTRKAAELASVDMRMYSVIYDAIEDVKKAMVGLLDPELKETWLGQVEVRKTIKVPKIGLIAGAYVLEGKITRNAEIRIVRDGVVIFQGKLASLRRFKDDVKEVVQGFECGIGIENYNDLKEGDIIEAFVMEETAREL